MHMVGGQQTFDWAEEFAVGEEAKLMGVFFQKGVQESSQDNPRKQDWLLAWPNYAKYLGKPREGS